MSLAPNRIRRWKRIEYERLIDGGMFEPGERLELVGGQLLVREPQGGAHALGIGLALDDESEPEPDVSVVGGALADAMPALPSRALLIVEVSDSSLALDRTEKASLYARAGIADYWILNLVESVLEVHREPTPEPAAPYGWRYRLIRSLAGGDVVSPLAAPQSRIPIARLTR